MNDVMSAHASIELLEQQPNELSGFGADDVYMLSPGEVRRGNDAQVLNTVSNFQPRPI